MYLHITLDLYVRFMLDYIQVRLLKYSQFFTPTFLHLGQHTSEIKLSETNSCFQFLFGIVLVLFLAGSWL